MRLLACLLCLALIACGTAQGPLQSSGEPRVEAARDPAGPATTPQKEATEPGETDADDDDDTLQDGVEDPDSEASLGGEVRPHPLDGWSPTRIEEALSSDPAALGTISLGSPNAGLLLNGVQAQDSELYKLVSPSAAFATHETLDYLAASIRAVHEEFPATPPLMLGDISAQGGGPLRPHISHQSGRDVDISYYYKTSIVWYARGTAKNLDLARNWAFVRALIATTDIDLILIDHSIQKLLFDHAQQIGEDPGWLQSIFKGAPGQRPIIRHARGHATHIHVRFFNPIAQETARRAYDALLRLKLVPAQHAYLHHRAKNGETLGMLAKKYGTTVRAIQTANRLRNTRIRAKVVYAIPVAAPAKPRPDPLRIPERRTPPLRRKLASSEP